VPDRKFSGGESNGMFIGSLDRCAGGGGRRSVEFEGEKNNPVPRVSTENSTSDCGRKSMLSRFLVIVYLRRRGLVCLISLPLDCVIFHVHARYRCEVVN
jgi:hypothetical protein